MIRDLAYESRATNHEPRIYIELVKNDDFPVTLELHNTSELGNVLSSYNTSINIKNGDKVILSHKGVLTLSRVGGRKSLALGIPIGVNSAGINDLTVLPGIGAKLARSIIEYRKQSGGYKSIDELIKVKGIGEKKLKAVRPFISLD